MAPVIADEVPSDSTRYHWWASAGAGTHAEVVAVSVFSTWAVPEIFGALTDVNCGPPGYSVSR